MKPEVIASYEHHFGGGGAFATPYLDFEVAGGDFSTRIFDGLVVDISNVGETFGVNADNSPSFAFLKTYSLMVLRTAIGSGDLPARFQMVVVRAVVH